MPGGVMPGGYTADGLIPPLAIWPPYDVLCAYEEDDVGKGEVDLGNAPEAPIAAYGLALLLLPIEPSMPLLAERAGIAWSLVTTLSSLVTAVSNESTDCCRPLVPIMPPAAPDPPKVARSGPGSPAVTGMLVFRCGQWTFKVGYVGSE